MRLIYAANLSQLSIFDLVLLFRMFSVMFSFVGFPLWPEASYILTGHVLWNTHSLASTLRMLSLSAHSAIYRQAKARASVRMLYFSAYYTNQN